MADLLLSSRGAELVACTLETALRDRRRQGRDSDDELRQLAAAVARAVPLTAEKLPSLLKAAGPEAAAAVKAEVTRIAGRKFDGNSSGRASSATATLSASEAAGIAGVSSRTIRAAAAAGRLVAVKDRITAAWRITTSALDEWVKGRHG